MKQLKWLASASVLLAMVVAIEGWPALRELAAHREWQAVEATANGASIDGLQIMIEEQVAAVAAAKPERAALLIRLKMHVTPAARASWKDCRVSLRDAAGHLWMPLTSASSDGAIKALTSDQKNFGLCRLYPRSEPEGEEIIQADQLFLLPANNLQNLQLHVSGIGIRPQALAFEINPALRRFP